MTTSMTWYKKILKSIFPNLKFSLSDNFISIPGILFSSFLEPIILALYFFFKSKFPPV